MPRVVHFEIPAEDPYRAVTFYKDVFGWKIDKWEGHKPQNGHPEGWLPLLLQGHRGDRLWHHGG